MSRLRLTFTGLSLDNPQLGCLSDLDLRVEADLTVELDGATVFAQPQVAVVELARELLAWAATTPRRDFGYHLLDGARALLLRISGPGALPEPDLVAAAHAFAADVIARCRTDLGLEVTPEVMR